jgi:amidase
MSDPRAQSKEQLPNLNLLQITGEELSKLLSANSGVTSRVLIQQYLDQISQYDGYLHSIIQLAPREVLDKIANDLDEERAKGKLRSPLHGVPIIIKVCFL